MTAPHPADRPKIDDLLRQRLGWGEAQGQWSDPLGRLLTVPVALLASNLRILIPAWWGLVGLDVYWLALQRGSPTDGLLMLQRAVTTRFRSANQSLTGRRLHWLTARFAELGIG
jgi:hypothetical protein